MPEMGSKELPKSEDDLTAKLKGGRPREYGWDALANEIIRIANSPDGLPETQAELIEDWIIGDAIPPFLNRRI